jgi:hypothetical protein
MIYIEEPEAHLFPEAQSRLVELIAYVLNEANNVSAVITTHSPYVLAKLNNLIKAGSLGSSGSIRSNKISEIIKRDRWLRQDRVAAFAIAEGQTRELIGKEGLIDADYLDGVSGTISNEFSRLLEIEYGSRK